MAIKNSFPKASDLKLQGTDINNLDLSKYAKEAVEFIYGNSSKNLDSAILSLIKNASYRGKTSINVDLPKNSANIIIDVLKNILFFNVTLYSGTIYTISWSNVVKYVDITSKSVDINRITVPTWRANTYYTLLENSAKFTKRPAFTPHQFYSKDEATGPVEIGAPVFKNYSENLEVTKSRTLFSQSTMYEALFKNYYTLNENKTLVNLETEPSDWSTAYDSYYQIAAWAAGTTYSVGDVVRRPGTPSYSDWTLFICYQDSYIDNTGKTVKAGDKFTTFSTNESGQLFGCWEPVNYILKSDLDQSSKLWETTEGTSYTDLVSQVSGTYLINKKLYCGENAVYIDSKKPVSRYFDVCAKDDGGHYIGNNQGTSTIWQPNTQYYKGQHIYFGNNNSKLGGYDYICLVDHYSSEVLSNGIWRTFDGTDESTYWKRANPLYDYVTYNIPNNWQNKWTSYYTFDLLLKEPADWAEKYNLNYFMRINTENSWIYIKATPEFVPGIFYMNNPTIYTEIDSSNVILSVPNYILLNSEPADWTNPPENTYFYMIKE